MAVKNFVVHCEMKEEWIPVFMSFLHHLQVNGAVGHSELCAIFSDGDGDFRPKFKTDVEWNLTSPREIREFSPSKAWCLGINKVVTYDI